MFLGRYKYNHFPNSVVAFALKFLTMECIILCDNIFVNEITECAECVQLNKNYPV